MINVTKPSMPSFEEYCNEIRELWDTCWLTNMGVKHKIFQKELQEFLNVPYVTLYTNGHLALENIISAMNFPAGSEIITTPFTFASTTHAIVRNGLVPIFCDINPIDYTIDVEKIEQLISKKTVAILPVHVYGHICDISGIKNISDKYSLKVIYDAAHAFGEKYKNESVARFGDASIFSFHSTKVFNTIEGGAVTYSDEFLVQILDDMKNFGIRGPEQCKYVGGNAKMNEFQASMGICNLRHFDEEIEKRKCLYNRYLENLDGINGIKLSYIQSEVQSNYAYCPIVFDKYSKTRDEVFNKLLENDIMARKYFYPLTSDFDCYRELREQDLSVAEDISNKVITLPLYSNLSIDDVDRICKIISH